jgi:hypothetical protein
MALLGRHGDAVLDLLAITTRRERAWINDLSLEDAVQLAAAVFEVNADFFVAHVVPAHSGRGPATRADAALADELGWDSAVARLIRAGHRLAT